MRKLIINNKITSRDSQSFKQYLRDISQIQLFTPEEEYNCGLRMEAGDENAKEEMVLRNLRFVVSAAKQYTSSPTQLEDLINEGNYGLIMAANTYKPSTGFKFISYAVHYVRKYMTEYLNKGKLVRLPANKVNSVSKMFQKVEVLEQQLGRMVDIGDIMDAFGHEEGIDELVEAVKLGGMCFDSLDKEVGNGGYDGGATLGDMIPNCNALPTDHLCQSNDAKVDISRYLKLLKPKNQLVLIGFFGLNGIRAKTLTELSEELGVSSEMIRQIKEKSLKIIREGMTKKIAVTESMS